MLGRKIEFVGLRVEFSRELAKFFLGEQIEGVATCRPAPGSKSAEIARGHGLPPWSPMSTDYRICCLLFLRLGGEHRWSQSHDVDGNLKHQLRRHIDDDFIEGGYGVSLDISDPDVVDFGACSSGNAQLAVV